MQLPEHFFIVSQQLTGGELIICARKPYQISRVYRFEDPKAMENFIIKYNLLNAVAKVEGFNILICYVGTIEDAQTAPVLGHNVPETFLTRINALKTFYEEERIKGNETRLKKYREG